MARFKGTIQGSRGRAASRLGAEGLTVHANGRYSGVTVHASILEYAGGEIVDVFQILATGGANDDGAQVELGRIVNGRLFPASCRLETIR